MGNDGGQIQHVDGGIINLSPPFNPSDSTEKNVQGGTSGNMTLQSIFIYLSLAIRSVTEPALFQFIAVYSSLFQVICLLSCRAKILPKIPPGHYGELFCKVVNGDTVGERCLWVAFGAEPLDKVRWTDVIKMSMADPEDFMSQESQHLVKLPAAVGA